MLIVKTVTLVIMNVKIDMIVLISDIIMCLISHSPMIFNYFQYQTRFVDADNITPDIKGEMSRLLINILY